MLELRFVFEVPETKCPEVNEVERGGQEVERGGQEVERGGLVLPSQGKIDVV